jgi:hypothetical protein
MENKLKSTVKLIALGLGLAFTLIGYADNKFATKSMLQLVFDKLQVIDARVYDIHKSLNTKDK